jgi:HNH endonuclease
MDRKTEHIARLRAGGVCEYCRLPEVVSHLQFPLDHVIARQHNGTSTEDNLALACPECNLHKGPNLSTIDGQTGEHVRLFHPRRDVWALHFRWDGATLVGLTAIGRGTVQLLTINAPTRVALRDALRRSGLFPGDPLPTRNPGETPP